MGDTSNEGSDSPKCATDPVESERPYNMRHRGIAKKRYNTRPERSSHTKVDYAKLAGGLPDEDDQEDFPKKKPKVARVSTTPSKARLAVQHAKSQHPKNKIPVPVVSSGKNFVSKNPNKIPVHRRCLKPEQDSKAEPQSEIPSPPPPPPDDSGVKSKGVFHTTEHGIKISKKVRYFRCPECGIHKDSTHKLNDHYKRRHKPIECEKCNQIFHTPSGYDRHQYTHAEPRHRCDVCGKRFYFIGELNQHGTVHRKIRAFAATTAHAKRAT